MCDLPEYVLELLHKIAKAERFVGDYRIDVKPGCAQGDGYLGLIASVTIDGTRVRNVGADAEAAQLRLVCKLPPTSAARRKSFQLIPLFKREVHMYGVVLPQLAAFEREKGLADDDRFTAYPRCYDIVVDDEKDHLVIIMEDVRARGYTMWDRVRPIPVGHLKALLQQLARMHAISFALKDQRPNVYASFRTVTDVVVDFLDTEAMNTAVSASYARCLNAVESERHIDMIKDITSNYKEYNAECMTDAFVGPYAAITHGDCWINNVLFCDGTEAKLPIDVCLVDWQMSRCGSVIMDLLYIMFTSIDEVVLRNDFKTIMDYYYTTLSESTRELGTDLAPLYSYDVFEADLKKFSKYGLLMGLSMAQVLVVDKDELHDLDEVGVKTNGTVDFVQGISGDSELKYKQRIRSLLDTFLHLGLY